MEKQFVYAKKDIELEGNVIVQKNDVGVIESESGEEASIFFIFIWRSVKLHKKDFQVFDVKKTGDGFDKKICNICHKLLDTTEFDKNQNGKNNRTVRRPSCKRCRTSLDGMNMSQAEKLKWKLTKPDKIPFECPICGKRTIAGVTSKVVLDHNHKTGLGRAWICDSCNTGIGRFKDDVTLIQKAMGYLKT